ncbi:Rrf2 family transcriptional regulator, partial [Rhizobium ruizarguesonis]
AVEGGARSFTCTSILANNPFRPEGYCDSRPCAVARIMGEADEAWRETLRRGRLSDRVGTLSEEGPADSGRSTFEG